MIFRIHNYLILGLLAAATPLVRGAEPVDFNRDIRPILSENCFHCHGPDANKREADLRLDVEDDARKDLGGYHALVPGKANESELWLRIATEDKGDLMPPPDSNRQLTKRQKDLIKQWIDSGGAYAEHWAYAKPVRPALPEVKNAAWVKNDVDRFILARLDQEGLEPSPEADRHTLIRRVSLDLTGLPPSPEEVSAFIKDQSPGAYERVVARLLESGRFGERWARPWLDLARYADSNGFQADQLRDSWAYRDWVIDALNANMPFDRFTIEQLAGDLLPNATLDQKIATGFHRTVTCNVEAGVHPEENRVNQVVDRVNTTGTVWLGTTLECCQCHDHKYDPFTMKDYYSLFAYFNNTPLEVENPGGKGVSFNFYGPKMDLPLDPEQEAWRAGLAARLKDLQARRTELAAASQAQRLVWEDRMRKALEKPAEWHVLEIVNFKSEGGETHRVLDDQSVLVTGPVPNVTHYEVTANTKLSGITAFKLEALTHEDLPGTGPGRGDAERPNFILSEFEVSCQEADAKELAKVPLAGAQADFSQPNWNVEFALDGDRKTGWAIGGGFQKDHWAVFPTAQPVGKAGQTTTLRFSMDQNYGRGRTLGRIRLSALVGDLSTTDMPGDLKDILLKPAKERSKKEAAKLDDYYAQTDPVLSKLDAELAKVKKQASAIEPNSTLVMVEMEEPRETHIMQRGNYLSPTDKVSPTTPERLHSLDPKLPKNRLGFAQWLMDTDNPLVARVTVNRWWAQLFGQGIVSTQEDFGTQAEPPTHPGLLDWLAVEFMESGWDMKHMLSVMVTSAAYRQSSDFTPTLLERDPENKLHARGPRFRMDAEMIRDNALTVSGLLSTKMHGEPIMPYQPDGLWRQVGRNEPKWVDEKDENRFRRGIYVIWRRAAPYPSFVNFDGPDRSSCVVARPRTNTPLQALTLLNDPAYVEMALALADRILREKPDAGVSERIDHAFELVLARPARSDEREFLRGMVEERLKALQKDEKTAREVVATGSPVFKPTKNLSTAELAAWFYVANVLLNLDETITKD